MAVGTITVGGGHAPISYNSRKTVEHYDNCGSVAAFVRAQDGTHGIWITGAVRSDLPAEKVRDLRANPPSGDWRTEGGSLELQGILAVPIPGFPVPRSEMRLVASGAEEEMVALVASGFADEEEEPETATFDRASYLEEKMTERANFERAWQRDVRRHILGRKRARRSE